MIDYCEKNEEKNLSSGFLVPLFLGLMKSSQN